MRTATTAASRRDGHKRLCGAISRALLAGPGREAARERALAAVAGASDKHVVAAFDGGGRQHGPFLGLYAMDAQNKNATRIFAATRRAPSAVHGAAVETMYKFDTTSRVFVIIDSARFAPRTDAVGLSRTG